MTADWWRWAWPPWRGRNRFSAYPLFLAPSPDDVREWNLDVDPACTPHRPFPTPTKIKATLHRILIEAGIALTPAQSSWDPRSWYALYRYGADFAGTAPRLRLYSGIQDVDPRIKQFAGEEIAVGITCYLLREHYDVHHIADAYGCIPLDLNYVSAASTERPDFLCQDSIGHAVIVESKGAVGSRGTVSRKISGKGWRQVNNVNPVRLPLRPKGGRIVMGTHICVDGIHTGTETTTIIKDPEGEEGPASDPTSDAVIRRAYAKAFRFAGQDVMADRFALGQPLPKFPVHFGSENLPKYKGIAVFPLGPTPFGEMIGLHLPLALAIVENPGSNISRAVHQSLKGFSEVQHKLAEVAYALPNGIVVVHRPGEFRN